MAHVEVRSRFPPSTMWILGTELGSFGLVVTS